MTVTWLVPLGAGLYGVRVAVKTSSFNDGASVWRTNPWSTYDSRTSASFGVRRLEQLSEQSLISVESPVDSRPWRRGLK
jgi:hypothetical protein